LLLRSTRIHLDDAVRRAELTADEAKVIFDRVHAHIDEIVDGSLGGGVGSTEPPRSGGAGFAGAGAGISGVGSTEPSRSGGAGFAGAGAGIRRRPLRLIGR
jgi:hypothetical protein